eukprot:4906412-Lingulodinium_polyedra.AAC.1
MPTDTPRHATPCPEPCHAHNHALPRHAVPCHGMTWHAVPAAMLCRARSHAMPTDTPRQARPGEAAARNASPRRA